MNGVRSRVCLIALATITVQVAVIALSMLRVCGDVEHTHGGTAAPDCPMHHHAEPPPAAQAHHDHGSMAADASRTDERVSCRCTSDVIAVYYGPDGVVAIPGPLLAPVLATQIDVSRDPQPASLLFPPDAPPPRPLVS